jgi:hypothetical protein
MGLLTTTAKKAAKKLADEWDAMTRGMALLDVLPW